MLLIRQFNANALQKQNLILPEGGTVQLTVYFRPLQQGWFINEMVYGTFTLRGVRITNSPNMLRQWGHIVPFGLACFTDANREPNQQRDFLSGASKLYLLTSAEVDEYAAFLAHG